MQAFTDIRREALIKRDKLIAKAKREYLETLTRVAALEQDLLGRETSRHKTIAACVGSLIPRDKPFTIVDILAGLEALDPGRVWRRRQVDHTIYKLRDKGIVRRLRKARVSSPALYIRADVQYDNGPFKDLTLIEVAALVLTDTSMNVTELTVALLEAGYQTDMTQTALRHALTAWLKRDERFELRGGKWGLGV